MRKEIVALILLLIMVGGAIWNCSHINNMSVELTFMLKKANTYEDVEAVINKWVQEERYTHMALRHSEVDTITSDLYTALEFLDNKEEFDAAKNRVIWRLERIQAMEQIRWGTVF
ncbi:MAG: DUF4363 family protein [Oscillospiraceae bacterium]|jgi:hypothetical protein|nr:DUF4363 family protein [Oscillospiraceae bacterium]